MNELYDDRLSRDRTTVRSTHDELVSAGEGIVRAGSNVAPEEVANLAKRLISVYDNPFNMHDLRVRAARVVGRLAEQRTAILKLVIENAQKYSERQHIDDADPYSPNSFDVLAEIGSPTQEVISFLQQIVRDDWGTPRWAAIRTLCAIEEPAAEEVLADFVKGVYPCVYPSTDDFDYVVGIIEELKGKPFITSQRLQK